MKKTFIVIALLLCSSALSAQSRQGRSYSDRDNRNYQNRSAQGRQWQGRFYYDGEQVRYPRRANDYGNVRMFEFEIGTGVNAGLAGGGWGWDDDRTVGVNLYIEPRLNIPHSPLSVAMQFSIGYSDNIGVYDYNLGYGSTGVSYNPSLVTFVDYNWRKWRNVSMFAGLGVGMAMVDSDYNSTYYAGPDLIHYWSSYGGYGDGDINYTDPGYSVDHGGSYHYWNTYTDRTMVLNPRFGVEFWNRLRLTAEYKFMKDDYSYFGMTVGVSIGGGRKGRGR